MRIHIPLTVILLVYAVVASAREPKGTNSMPVSAGPAAVQEGAEVVQVANLIYAGSKSSVCFSPKFLASLAQDTNIDTDPLFSPVKLSSDTVFNYPFAIMTGEGTFTLLEQERKNLASYLRKGGFLLASAGCSSQEWNRSFRAEMARIFPGVELKKIGFDHALFRTVYTINAISLKNGGQAQLEGLELNGRIVLVYSAEGLNDTPSVKGCCCCGGNEIKNSHELNVNIFAYAVLH